MFQSYEKLADRGYPAERLPLVRAALDERDLDGLIIPRTDEFQNEYTPEYAQRLRWVCGFTGSHGIAVVLRHEAVLLSIPMYASQAAEEVDEELVPFESIAKTSLSTWIAARASKGDRVGYDPMLHTCAEVERLGKELEDCGVELARLSENLIDGLWMDQPVFPTEKIVPHSLTYAGLDSGEKRRAVAKQVAGSQAEAMLLTFPPSIAWLLNVRGRDVRHTPLPLCRLVLYRDGRADLFVHMAKVDDALSEHLGENVTVREYDELAEVLEQLGARNARVALDPELTPSWFADHLVASGATVVRLPDPCALLRARKNGAELDGCRKAHILDGVAVTRFLHWISQSTPSGAVNEMTASQKLEEFRSECGALEDVSFPTISAMGPHGAMPHYRVTEQSALPLDSDSLYLVDSGGQYLHGTTDITRTVPIGTPTSEMRDRFTRVLKGHIAFATLKFPAGTPGSRIDAIARRALWDVGLDYPHGTGHGVGSYLNVHEGPHYVGWRPGNGVALEPGMVLSNEPGYYKRNEYGIRIENMMVVRAADSTAAGEERMLCFETLTLAPIDRNLIDSALLGGEELAWLNEYFRRVRDVLTPRLPDDVASWLEFETREIEQQSL